MSTDKRLEIGNTPSALAIQVLPLGIPEREKLWEMVDRAIQAIDAAGLSYTVGPFETVVEGPLDKLLEVAAAVHRTVLASGVPTGGGNATVRGGAAWGTGITFHGCPGYR